LGDTLRCTGFSAAGVLDLTEFFDHTASGGCDVYHGWDDLLRAISSPGPVAVGVLLVAAVMLHNAAGLMAGYWMGKCWVMIRGLHEPWQSRSVCRTRD